MWRQSYSHRCFLVGACLLLAVRVAGEPATQPLEAGALETRVAGLLKQLESDNYQDREAAGATMAKLPPEALPLLEAAIKRPDLPAETRNWLQLAIEPMRKGTGRVQRMADRLAYNRKTLVDAYDKIGKKDPKWDAPARKGLELSAVYYTRSAILDEQDSRAALASLRAAVTKGCDDPMVSYLAIRFVKEARFQQLYKAAQNLRASDYPAARKFGAFEVANERRYRQYSDDVAVTRKRIVDSLAYVAAMAAEKDTPADLIVDLLGGAMDTYKRCKGDRKELYDQIDAELAKSLPEDSLVRLNLKGRYYTSWAWDARGGDWAANVTDQGWKDFSERLGEAQKILEHAYTLYPNDPIAPTQMISVELGQGQGRARMEQWFDRATNAAPECIDAYRKKMYYLAPRWHGSEAEQLKFGRECLAAGDFASRVPLMVISAYREQAESTRYGVLVKRPEMGTDEAWADVSAAYDGYLAANPENDLDYTAYLKLALDAGRWKEADAIFKKIGDHLDTATFGGDDLVRLTKLDLAHRLADPPNFDPTARRTVEKEQELKNWRKMLLDDYAAVGSHNEKWDASVKFGLAALANAWGHSDNCKGDEIDVAHASLDKAVAAGCDDPMVKTVAAWITDGEFAIRGEGYVNTSLALLPAFFDSKYSASLKFSVGADLIDNQFGRSINTTKVVEHTQKDGKPTLDALIALLPLVQPENLLRNSRFAEQINNLSEDYIWLGEAPDVVNARIQKAMADAKIDQRTIDYERAWFAEYDGWRHFPTKKRMMDISAKKPEFAEFTSRVEESRKIFESLWVADPCDQVAPKEMIDIATLQRRPREYMEFWFRQALLPDPHYFAAYKNKYEYLAPWNMAVNSDYSDQLDFGHQCIHNGPATSEIPFISAMGWINWASWSPGGKPPMAEPAGPKIAEQHVWYNLNAVYSRYLTAYPANHKRRSEYAKLACLAEKWDVADREFKTLGDNVRVKEFGSQQRLDAFRKQAAEDGPTMPKQEKEE